LVLYLFWKIFSAVNKDPRINHRGWKLFLRANEIDIWSGIRPGVLLNEEQIAEKRAEREKLTTMDHIIAIPKAFATSLFI